MIVVALLRPGGLAAQDADFVPLPALLAELSRKTELRFNYESSALDSVRLDPELGADWSSLRAALPDLGVAVREEADGAIVLAPVAADRPPPPRRTTLELEVTNGAEPLIGATVRLADGTGTATDLEGRATLALVGDSATATIRYLGYAATEVLLTRRTPRYRIALRSDTVVVRGVEVVAALPERPWRAPSDRAAGGSGAGRGALRLPASSLAGFGFSAAAGVSQIDAEGSAPGIRGSQGFETRVELDGLPLYHVDHLYGLFSAVNPLTVADVHLHRSHYPVDRGGVRGGLMAIETIEPPTSGLTLQADQVAGALEAHAAAPAVRAMVSARSSFGDVASGTAFESVNEVDTVGSSTARTVPSFTFYDLYGRVSLGRDRGRWRGSVNGYVSRDRYGFSLDDARELDDRRVPATLTGSYREDVEWRNAALGGDLSYQGDVLTYTLEGYLTTYENEVVTDAEFALERRSQTRVVELIANRLDNTVSDAQIGLRLLPSRGAGRWQAGVQVQRLSTVAFFQLNDRRALDRDDTDHRVHAYAANVFQLGEGLEADIGLRASYAEALDDAWASPRIALTRAIRLPSGRGVDLTAGYSFTRQALASLQHENQFGQTYALLVLEAPRSPVISSAHTYTAGGKYDGLNFYLGAEGYYRSLPGVLATLSTSPGLRGEEQIFNPRPTFLSVEGEGEVIGVDVDARWRAGGWDGSLAYTLARSRQRFPAIDDNNWQRAPDDRRHRLAAQQSFSWQSWRVSAAYEGASGLVFNDIAEFESSADRRGFSTDQLQTSLPAYHRADIGLAYELRVGGAELTLGGRVVNVFDRFNVTQRQYVLGLGSNVSDRDAVALGTDVGLLGRLWLAEVKLAL